MTWATIRTGFKTRLDTIGLPLVVKARTPIAVVEDDIAIIEIGQAGISPAGHSLLTEIGVRVILIVNRATVDDSENALDAYLWPSGSSSVVAAVRADPTLGGAVDTTFWISSGTPYGTPEGMPTGRQSEVQFRCIVNA